MFDAPEETSLVEVRDSGMEVVQSAGALLVSSEVETQLAAAHRYPRSVKRALDTARTMAMLSRDVAESCMYALPRGGKSITGPSVRLAEVMASAWGNLQIGSRVVEVTDKEVVAEGFAWDLENNNRIRIEARRRITNKGGKRFDDDMIGVTGMAASSVALRNAIFRIIPRAYVDTVYQEAIRVAVGDAKTLDQRRGETVARLQRGGIAIERILARIEKPSVQDIGLGELEVLVGLISSMRSQEITPDEAFPEVDKGEARASALSAAVKGKRDELPPKAPSSAPEVHAGEVVADADGVVT